jgi:DNA-binding NtrC family response regulator
VAEGLLGGSAFAARLAELRKIAGSPLSIVLEGETGSGKEQLARAVHCWSGRTGPLVTINCAALPEQLAESELFGHRRGAFTGATEAALGYLRSAEGGTLFLDEVLELPLAIQAKLLRSLEAREVVPLGETRAHPLNIRVICATQSALGESVQKGSFRSDLLARLAEYRFVIPPLRERREDIPGLFSHLLAEACGGTPPRLSPKLVELLCTEQWSLNVRQLRSVARQMAVLHSHEALLDVKHFCGDVELPASAATAAPAARVEPPIAERDRDDLERLEAALRSQQGQLGKAAQEARLSRQRAQRLLERYPWRDPRRPN